MHIIEVGHECTRAMANDHNNITRTKASVAEKHTVSVFICIVSCIAVESKMAAV